MQYPRTPTGPAAMQPPTGQLTARFSRIQAGFGHSNHQRGFPARGGFPANIVRGNFARGGFPSNVSRHNNFARGGIRSVRGRGQGISRNLPARLGRSVPYVRIGSVPSSRGRRGRGRRDRNPVTSSTRSDLDRELDGYMLQDEGIMRNRLDRDLDTYMTDMSTEPTTG